MAPSLFRAVRPAAQLYRSSAPSTSSRLLSTTARRTLATEYQDSGPHAKAVPTSPATSAYTVEELHDKSAQEILREGGTRRDRSLRHFTVNFGPQHPAAHGVLRLILELNGEEILRTDVSFIRPACQVVHVGAFRNLLHGFSFWECTSRHSC